MRKIEDILEDIKKIEDKIDEAFGLPTIEEYMARCEELWEEKMPLIFERDSQVEPKWEDISGGDLMELEDFIECCESGGFIDYDGFGHYSDGKRESSVSIAPSMAAEGMIIRRPEFTHVVWYNR